MGQLEGGDIDGTQTFEGRIIEAQVIPVAGDVQAGPAAALQHQAAPATSDRGERGAAAEPDAAHAAAGIDRFERGQSVKRKAFEIGLGLERAQRVAVDGDQLAHPVAGRQSQQVAIVGLAGQHHQLVGGEDAVVPPRADVGMVEGHARVRGRGGEFPFRPARVERGDATVDLD